MWQRFNEQSLLVYQELPNGLITQFTYDAQGNMSRQWDNAGRDKTYQYDQNGKLVQFIFNQDREVIAEQNSLGITRYIRSSELIARNTDAARTYYHYVSDEIGSVTHVVDADGIVLNRYEYDAWGNTNLCEEKVPNRFKFTGQQLDPVTQQYYLRARFYNPVIARFTQEDTYRGDGLNLYAYCQNNPVFYADPSGNIASCLKEAYHTKLEQLSKEYVTDNMSAEEKTAALQQAKKDAYQAAKEVYQANHAVNNPAPSLPRVSGRSMTQDQWRSAYRQTRIGENQITFYHGTTTAFASAIKANGVDLSHANRDMDFGRGFYVTKLEDQAFSWSQSVGKRHQTAGDVVIFDVPQSALDALNTKTFESANTEWGEFVLAGRQGAKTEYDIVSGPYLSNPNAFVNKHQAPNGKGQQTAFLTQKAVSILNQSIRR